MRAARLVNIAVLDTKSVGRRLVVALLRNPGHAVREGGWTSEALTLVREQCPDLLIVDIAAPDMDGCRFVVQMRCEPRPLQPPVLMRAAAGVEAEARALAHAFGASCVVKPTNPELLLATLSATVGEPAPQQRGPPCDGQP